MVKLQSREGFSIAAASACLPATRNPHAAHCQAEVKRFKEVFDRFDDNGNAEARHRGFFAACTIFT